MNGAKSPWMTMRLGGQRVEILDPEHQLVLLRKFDAEKLRGVIAWPDTAPQVRTAARERLGMLHRAGFGMRPTTAFAAIRARVERRPVTQARRSP